MIKYSDEVVYLVGGFSCNLGYVMDVWRYNMFSEKWTLLDMQSVKKVSPIGRIGHSLTLRNKIGFMVGGIRNQILLNDIWTIHF